jgi:hypothetical protein
MQVSNLPASTGPEQPAFQVDVLPVHAHRLTEATSGAEQEPNAGGGLLSPSIDSELRVRPIRGRKPAPHI